MFEQFVSEAQAFAGAAAIGAWARVEAAACARKLAAMVAVLDRLYAVDGSAEREQWYLDNWGAVCAEIAAAQQITSSAASHQLLIATALRDRLPGVAAVFAEGRVSYRLVSTIVWRTALVKDPEALHALDVALASALRDWEPMSEKKTVESIDYLVDRFDPYALRRNQTQARSRCIEINVDDPSGTASLWGSLFTHDAVALDRRLDVLAATTCPDDPRTVDQRRADAMGALANGADQLACQCDRSDCVGTPAVSSMVIHVVANPDAISDTDLATVPDETAALDGVAPPRPQCAPLREQTLAEALADLPPTGPAVTTPGLMIGGPVLPGPALRRAVVNATVKAIIHPARRAPEPRYVPSCALADFVRCRDLTCRFPGCDEPADRSDIDHTVAYPLGPTQASNLKCLCRKHHLLKTFWGGDGGWHDRQLCDGTVIWTSPEGLTQVTRPGSHLMFPALCVPTAPVVIEHADGQKGPHAGLAMPVRAATRAQARRARIEEERLLNEAEMTPPDQPTRPC